MNSILENTTTKTDHLPELQKAVRQASKHERELALEVDALPARLQQLAKEDARRQARAAREGGTGQAVQEAAEQSAVPAMLDRQRNLPFLRRSAGILTASLELELADEQIRLSEEKANKLKVGLEGLKMDADEANRKFQERLSAVRRAESGASMLAYARHTAKQRLKDLEAAYPNA